LREQDNADVTAQRMVIPNAKFGNPFIVVRTACKYIIYD